VGMAITTADRRRKRSWRCSCLWMMRARSSRESWRAMVTTKGGDLAFATAETIFRIVKPGGVGWYDNFKTGFGSVWEVSACRISIWLPNGSRAFMILPQHCLSKTCSVKRNVDDDWPTHGENIPSTLKDISRGPIASVASASSARSGSMLTRVASYPASSMASINAGTMSFFLITAVAE